MKRTIRDLELKGKRVLIRADLNVPLDDAQNITDLANDVLSRWLRDTFAECARSAGDWYGFSDMIFLSKRLRHLSFASHFYFVVMQRGKQTIKLCQSPAKPKDLKSMKC